MQWHIFRKIWGRTTNDRNSGAKRLWGWLNPRDVVSGWYSRVFSAPCRFPPFSSPSSCVLGIAHHNLSKKWWFADALSTCHNQYISCDHPNKPNSTCPIWLVHVGLPDITCGALGTFSKHFSGAHFLRNPTLQKGEIQKAMITKKQNNEIHNIKT